MIRNTNNLPQYPVSPNSGGGLVLPNQYMVINMEKCIPNSQGQQQTVPVAGVFATLDGRTPNNNDIGTRIVYEYDPQQSVHIITGVQPITPQVGSVPTPWVTTNFPCGGGVTTPRSIIAVKCPMGPGLPYPYNFLARINGQSPNQSHIGQTIIDVRNNDEYKVTAVTNLAPPPGMPVTMFNTTNNPCVQQQNMAREIYLEGCPNEGVDFGTGTPAPTQGPHTAFARINGQTPTNADIGKIIIPPNQYGGSSPSDRVKVLGIAPPHTVTGPVIDYVTSQVPCIIPIPGCTDPQAINYNPQATSDDGSCQYAPPPNPTTPRYISLKECPILPTAPIVNGWGVIDGITPNPSHIGQTIVSYVGGTARLFKVMGLPVLPPNAVVPTLPIAYTTTNSPCPTLQNPSIQGCTDPQAINFNPQATLDNGTCQYAPRPNPITPRPMDMMQDSDTSEAMSDIVKGRGLSDERMKRYKQLRG